METTRNYIIHANQGRALFTHWYGITEQEMINICLGISCGLKMKGARHPEIMVWEVLSDGTERLVKIQK